MSRTITTFADTGDAYAYNTTTPSHEPHNEHEQRRSRGRLSQTRDLFRSLMTRRPGTTADHHDSSSPSDGVFSKETTPASLKPGSATPAGVNPEPHRRRATNVEADLRLIRTRSSQRRPPKWWRIYWGRGMYRDVKRRIPYYLSDWTDAWDYRVVPATVYMYFANILPALAFSLDMFDRTKRSYGVNEVLLSSVLGAGVFSVFGCQPLTIVGVTGPITIFNYTVYDIMEPTGVHFFPFMGLIGIWAMAMHWILALTNSCNGLKYVTRFSCDTFGFYVALVYLQKGVQVLTRQFAAGSASAYLSIMVALLVLMVAYGCGIVGDSLLFQRTIRKFIEDYGTPLTIIFFTGFVHIGKMRGINLEKLPTSKAFFPTTDRSWFVDFWNVRGSDVGSSFGFAVILTILFWFDHNVSSLIAQGTEFPLRKPAGFHWDIFLLGVTTGVAGILGIPFPNGLIPQAPFHTNALCVTRTERDPHDKSKTIRVVDHVVEQRVSNLAQGLLTLGTMTGPLLIVIHLIPQGVLAGLFFVMGTQALTANGIVAKLFYLCRDRHLSEGDSLKGLKRQYMIWAFVAVQLFDFGVAFAITQTIAAIGFPIIIILLIPIRAFLLPVIFTKEELDVLDSPTASPFTMESVGGQYGEEPLGRETSNGGGDWASTSGSGGLEKEQGGIEFEKETGTGMEKASGSGLAASASGVAADDAAEMGQYSIGDDHASFKRRTGATAAGDSTGEKTQ